MANTSAEWSIGWIVSSSTDFHHTKSIFGPYCQLYRGIGHDDNLEWLMGDVSGKTVFLVHAKEKYHALASAAMKERFGIKVLFIGGTYESVVYASPPIGHFALQLQEVDENRYDRLSATIPGEDIISLAKLVNAMDRFADGLKSGHFNLDQRIGQWAAGSADVLNGLVMPEMRIPPTYYQGWLRIENNRMCCAKVFNSGNYKNQTPCLKVLSVRSYKGASDNDVMWEKYAALASAAAISFIIENICIRE